MDAQALREVFNLFDKDNNGSLSAKELGVALRTLGQAPTDAELLEMVKYVKQVHEWNVASQQGRSAVSAAARSAPGKGMAATTDAAEAPPIAQQLNEATISLEMFTQFVASKVKEIEIEEELKAALQIFELPNRPGHIQLSTLRTAVTSWGDRLASDEVEEMIKDADASEDGIVVIEDFIRSIMLR
jgi:calmodulin